MTNKAQRVAISKAQKVAHEIEAFYSQGPEQYTARERLCEIMKMLEAEYGDGLDKERLDWIDGKYFSLDGWLKFHGEHDIRKAIDAERGK